MDETTTVFIDVDVFTAKVGVYGAHIQILTANNETVVCDKTVKYPRRTRSYAERKSFEKARNWIAEHGYVEYVEPEVAQ